MLLARFLRPIIKQGHLIIIDADERHHEFGHRPPGTGEGQAALVIRLTDPALHWKLALAAEAYAGEAYMDGSLVVERGTLYDLIALLADNTRHTLISPLGRWSVRLRRVLQFLHQHNPVARSRSNVAHHYDLNGRLYDLFLDPDRQYSCAYFPRPGMDLAAAQLAKKRHIIAKLLLRPGQRVLDIGSGWGGMALEIARTVPDVTVLGITLSQEQLAVAQARAAQEGLAERVRFILCDYRHVAALPDGAGRPFDRIVSVGMFEHVGLPHFADYFTAVRDLLTPDGVALLHAIGRLDGPGVTNPWIRKYIFPGGYAPALSEVTGAIEPTGLLMADIEILRLHYAETLRFWRDRFMARRDEAAALYDERFVRMWEFYLAGAECAFRYQGQMVFQIQLARQLETVPLTRDYIHMAEQDLVMEGPSSIAVKRTNLA